MCVSLGGKHLEDLETHGSPVHRPQLVPCLKELPVNRGLLARPSDTAPSLAGFVHQEEEEVTPQLPCGAGPQDVGWEERAPPPSGPLSLVQELDPFLPAEGWG